MNIWPLLVVSGHLAIPSPSPVANLTTGGTIGAGDLLSGIIGGLVGAAAAIVAAVIVRNSDRAIFERGRVADAKNAGRLIAVELRRNGTALMAFKKSQTLSEPFFVHPLWDAHAPPLPELLSASELIGVANAYDSHEAVAGVVNLHNNASLGGAGLGGFFVDPANTKLLDHALDTNLTALSLLASRVFTDAERAEFEEAAAQ